MSAAVPEPVQDQGKRAPKTSPRSRRTATSCVGCAGGSVTANYRGHDPSCPFRHQFDLDLSQRTGPSPWIRHMLETFNSAHRQALEE
jgi:hypothetical protein